MGKLTVTPDNITTDMFILESWASAQQWALKQAEETFCDFIGILMFGTAYLYSFAYLIAPTWGGTRSFRYPGQLTRVENMKEAATEYDIILPDDYDTHFDDLIPPRGTEQDLYLLEIADKAFSLVIADLIKDAKDAIDKANIPLPSTEEQQKILARFRKVVPPENVNSLADILNAAWLAAEDRSFWQENPAIDKKDIIILRDLVLKAVEILDIEQTLKENA